ncbi:Bol2p [Ascoidea rubescens DSM 1968]|uniref:Bola-domain-containing protein n=1 Tax=Ascoidea rubescens DSM 1968 TaxID=1344418 RepID=A0A1D2V9A1_9ASCO|nr:bola-domain-containing protein [Ascoidea rubescens DSM 1968]ODV58139.1 bola-domain-containing protein [Ascoidea rubescens DSM 1968]
MEAKADISSHSHSHSHSSHTYKHNHTHTHPYSHNHNHSHNHSHNNGHSHTVDRANQSSPGSPSSPNGSNRSLSSHTKDATDSNIGNKKEHLTSSSLEKIIKERLNASIVHVQDMSGGCGQAFAVIIVSEIFNKKNRIMRHRLVNSALKEEISAIHAFTQKNFTPEEWEIAKKK